MQGNRIGAALIWGLVVRKARESVAGTRLRRRSSPWGSRSHREISPRPEERALGARLEGWWRPRYRCELCSYAIAPPSDGILPDEATQGWPALRMRVILAKYRCAM